MKAGGGQPMPLEWARRIMEGESPVRVWREFRGLSCGRSPPKPV
jgi:hypothetical protein